MGNTSTSPTREILENENATIETNNNTEPIEKKALRRRSRSEADMGKFVSKAITRTLSKMDDVQSSILSSFFIPPSHFKNVKVLAAGGGGQILRAHFDDELVALKRTYGLAMGGMVSAFSTFRSCNIFYSKSPHHRTMRNH